MHYDFIEIGTSDFKTLIESDKGIGLSVEPLKLYLDNLPDRENVTKVNYGISNVVGETSIYYVKPDDIVKYNLPIWVRGCNSINAPHPSIQSLLGDQHDEIITIDVVKIVNWEVLIKEYNITSVHFLKIDTEGHDAVILRDYYENCLLDEKLLAERIVFENNVLSDELLVQDIISDFKKLGYSGKQISYDYELIKTPL